MSIEYQAGIAIGYKLTPEEIQNIDEDIFEELVDSDLLHNLDTWCDQGDWILGDLVKVLDVDEGLCVPVKDCRVTDERYLELYDLWNKVFPHTEHPIIKKYLFGRVY